VSSVRKARPKVLSVRFGPVGWSAAALGADVTFEAEQNSRRFLDMHPLEWTSN